MRERDTERRFLQKHDWVATYDVVHRFVNGKLRSKSAWKWLNPRFNGAFTRNQAMMFERRRQNKRRNVG
jgi:hypothetical protein